MLIKICGVEDPKIAKMALKAGANLIGLVLTPTSRRFVPFEKALAIIEAIQEENSKPVLVFWNESFDFIAPLAEKAGDCIVQFQGEKHPDGEKLMSTFETIVAFSSEEWSALTKEESNYCPIFQRGRAVTEEIRDPLSAKKTIPLIDNQEPGSGKNFCWETFKQPDFPWFLAGGLHSGNVCQAMSQLNPACVDVSTGVEDEWGQKDVQKILRFIEVVNEKLYSS